MGRLVWALPTEPLCLPSHQPLAHHLLKPTPRLRPGGRSGEVTPGSAAPAGAPPQGAQPTASVAQGRLSLSNQDALTAAAPSPCLSRGPLQETRPSALPRMPVLCGAAMDSTPSPSPEGSVAPLPLGSLPHHPGLHG